MGRRKKSTKNSSKQVGGKQQQEKPKPVIVSEEEEVKKSTAEELKTAVESKVIEEETPLDSVAEHEYLLEEPSTEAQLEAGEELKKSEDEEANNLIEAIVDSSPRSPARKPSELGEMMLDDEAMNQVDELSLLFLYSRLKSTYSMVSNATKVTRFANDATFAGLDTLLKTTALILPIVPESTDRLDSDVMDYLDRSDSTWISKAHSMSPGCRELARFAFMSADPAVLAMLGHDAWRDVSGSVASHGLIGSVADWSTWAVRSTLGAGYDVISHGVVRTAMDHIESANERLHTAMHRLELTRRE